MREIKFRIWDDLYKYMNYKVIVGIYGEWEKVKDDENYTACAMWIEPKNVDYKCEPHWSHFEPYHKDIKLMQYTGLKDKNGKEIYEGDIVRVTYREENIGKVIYEHNGFTIDVMNMNRDYGRVSFVNNFIEVIGNIYENKNLLEKGKEE